MGILPIPDLSGSKLARKLENTVKENWYLGFTSFGGPPVHFKIVSPLGLAQGGKDCGLRVRADGPENSFMTSSSRS